MACGSLRFAFVLKKRTESLLERPPENMRGLVACLLLYSIRSAVKCSHGSSLTIMTYVQRVSANPTRKNSLLNQTLGRVPEIPSRWGTPSSTDSTKSFIFIFFYGSLLPLGLFSSSAKQRSSSDFRKELMRSLPCQSSPQVSF